MPKTMTKVNDRKVVPGQEYGRAMGLLRDKLFERLKEKGRCTHASQHETLGILTEEMREYEDEVHSQNHERQVEELLDIAVGCIWGVASIKCGGYDH